MSYLEADAGGQLGGAKIRPERQKIRVGKGKAAKLVPFAEATRAQVTAATRALLGKTGSSTAKVPPVVASLKKALAAAGLADVAVSMRGGKVAMSGIAPESLAALAKALKSHLAGVLHAL